MDSGYALQAISFLLTVFSQKTGLMAGGLTVAMLSVALELLTH